MVVFGAGYGWDSLVRACWPRESESHCWGGIDTHGFAIRDQLRGRLRRVRSFLMGYDTLMAVQPLRLEQETIAVGHVEAALTRLDG